MFRLQQQLDQIRGSALGSGARKCLPMGEEAGYPQQQARRPDLLKRAARESE